jgi:hypothetical protein
MLLLIIFIFTFILAVYAILCYCSHRVKHNLCIMAIFKNEHEYMEEWLKHHIRQGISHFYLYCNDEHIENYKYLDLYKPYITLIDWTNVSNNGSQTIQRQAYTHCVQHYNKYYKYILMLDLDEFIVSSSGTVIDYINSLDYNNTCALKIPRFNFGSDGHIKKPAGNVMDNYFTKEKICSSYKTIANSQYIDTSQNFYGVHDFNLLNSGKIYNAYLSYAKTGFPSGCSINDINETPLVINHYFTKSYDEYIKRCSLWTNGGINPVNYRKDCASKFHLVDIHKN